jgi:hypothetical protein
MRVSGVRRSHISVGAKRSHAGSRLRPSLTGEKHLINLPQAEHPLAVVDEFEDSLIPFCQTHPWRLLEDAS